MRTSAVLLLGGSLALSACTARAESPPAATCEQPSPALLARIAGAAPAGSGFRVVASAARRADGHALTTFVAVRFVARGHRGTGVWAVGPKLDGTGTLLAVDAEAQRWSSALAGDVAAAGLQKTEGAEALGCLP